MSKKTHSHRPKTPALHFGMTLLCAMFAALLAADAPPFRPILAEALSSEVQCGADSGIVLTLSNEWQQVALEQPGLLCAFRNKTGGFPSLNIIQEAAHQPDITPGVMTREASLRNAYHLVGLTDAKFSDSRIEPLGQLESFHTSVRYMNLGMPMEGLIMQVQLSDRLYTVSIVDREGHAKLSKEALLGVLRSIRIPGQGPTQAPLSAALPIGTALIVIGIIAASLLGFGLLTTRNRR